MPRLSRMKFQDPSEGYYHITARTIQKSFILKEEEKQNFQALLKKLSRVYFVKVATFSVMTNHIHIVLRMLPTSAISDNDIERRFKIYYNEGKPEGRWREYDPEEIEIYRQRWSDISRFVQDLLQRFSRWYNRKYDGYGHVWADRFKSVMLGSDRALMACMVYVDLNSVRAGIAKNPEKYLYCGLYQMVRGGRTSSWLDESAISDVLQRWGDDVSNPDRVIKRYTELVYNAGSTKKEGKAHISDQKDNDLLRSETITLRSRVRHFTEGVVLGDKAYCEKKFHEFRSYFHSSTEKEGSPLLPQTKEGQASPTNSNLLEDLFSIRKFKIVN